MFFKIFFNVDGYIKNSTFQEMKITPVNRVWLFPTKFDAAGIEPRPTG